MATNQSLERGIAILDLLDGLSGEIGIREMARILNLSPAIVQRLTNTLAQAGYLEQVTETRRYRLGYRALLLGSAMRRDDRMLATASDELRRLADEHRLDGYLGVLRDGNVIYLHCVHSSAPIGVRVMPGARANPHCTAMAKALLAELAPEEVARVVGPPPFPKLAPNTIVDSGALADELATIRRQAFALARQENLPGVDSVGAVIRDMSGRAVAAISVAFLVSDRPDSDMPGIIQLVTDAARRCSQSLGHASVFDRTREASRNAA